ncbi:MAG: HEPN domain-containing protein [Chloroflexi bacterium]|nr:HEPN domain-containing protein [Chloroflexota bacterium]
MSEAKRQLVRNWLTTAKHDLGTARKLSVDPDPYLDTAIFHCQQTAEKAVKGFLVYSDQPFEKTHDIRLLVMLAATHENQFSVWLDVGQRLTPYAIRFRYPAMASEPTKTEFDQALKDADAIYNFVLSLLPIEMHPS